MIGGETTQPSVVAAFNWLAGVAAGSIGTAVAALAVAAVGIAMLQGRLPARKGATVVVGCFILFSSQAVSIGILDATSPGRFDNASMMIEAPTYVAPAPTPVPYDPYAGASVPLRSQERAYDLIPH